MRIDRDAMLGEHPHQVVDTGALPHAERRGRLVEDDDLGRERHCPRDRHGLALAARHLGHVDTDVRDVHAQPLEGRPGLGGHLPLPQQTQASGPAMAR